LGLVVFTILKTVAEEFFSNAPSRGASKFGHFITRRSAVGFVTSIMAVVMAVASFSTIDARRVVATLKVSQVDITITLEFVTVVVTIEVAVTSATERNAQAIATLPLFALQTRRIFLKIGVKFK